MDLDEEHFPVNRNVDDIHTVIEGECMGIVLGSWLAVMGLFGLGCAGGTCFNGNCDVGSEKGLQNENEFNN